MFQKETPRRIRAQPGSLLYPNNRTQGEAGVRCTGPDNYAVLENAPTKRSARPMGADLKTRNVVLPLADLEPPKEGERRPTMKPGTFVLIVVGK